MKKSSMSKVGKKNPSAPIPGSKPKVTPKLGAADAKNKFHSTPALAPRRGSAPMANALADVAREKKLIPFKSPSMGKPGTKAGTKSLWK